MSAAAVPFLDTHAFVKRPVAAAMPEAQAEALTEAINEAMAGQDARQRQATVQVVREVDTKMEQAILNLKGEMNERFARQDAHLARLEERMDGQFKLLSWMLGILITIVVAIALKLFLG